MDDWMMTIAVVPFAALSVSSAGSAFHGIGAHAYRFEQPENERYVKLSLLVGSLDSYVEIDHYANTSYSGSGFSRNFIV